MVLCRRFDPRDERIQFKTVLQPPIGHFCSPREVEAFDCAKVTGNDHLKQKRARKFRCKSQRIQELATPKYYTAKYAKEDIPLPCKPEIEIVRSYQEDTPTRIKMLAYPKVRKLLSARNEYNHIIDLQRKERYKSLIDRSMLTMYSRLANVHLPVKSKHKKWKRADWQRHCEWLQRRALPKVHKNARLPVKSKKVPLDSLINTIQKLSKPRQQRSKYRPWFGYKSTVKNAALHYAPSTRILQLAEAKEPIDDDSDEFDPFQVQPNALKYQPTLHLKSLALPKQQFKPKEEPQTGLTKSGVLERALKAKANPRTEELAQPRENKGEEEEGGEKPLVSKKALKAKATKRILELAKPRDPVKN